MELKALHMLSKCSITELYPKPFLPFWVLSLLYMHTRVLLVRAPGPLDRGLTHMTSFNLIYLFKCSLLNAVTLGDRA